VLLPVEQCKLARAKDPASKQKAESKCAHCVSGDAQQRLWAAGQSWVIRNYDQIMSMAQPWKMHGDGNVSEPLRLSLAI